MLLALMAGNPLDHIVRHPTEGQRGFADAASSRWRRLDGLDLVVATYVSRDGVGLFVRGHRGADAPALTERLAPYAQALEQTLGADFAPTTDGKFLAQSKRFNMSDRATWDAASDWLISQSDRYASSLASILGASA